MTENKATLESFVHRYLPAESEAGPTLLLLHGTGGTEEDLIPLARELLPGAGILSPRGQVSENGMPRFFRRLAMGVFDEEDLIQRTHELASFVAAAAQEYGFDPDHLTAVGYSNGANIAGSLMLLHPRSLRSAVLFRAMVPFDPTEDRQLPDLSHASVLIQAGSRDEMIPQENTRRLGEILQSANASVDLRWRDIGHGLVRPELDEAREWMNRNVS